MESLVFSQSCASPVIKSHWPSVSDSWGFLVSLLDPQPGKTDVGLRTFTTVGGLLWYYFSPVCELPTQQAWEFDFIMIAPLLQSYCGFSFVFGCGVSLIGGFQYPPVNGCSTDSCDFSVLTGGDECMSFYSVMLNQKLEFNFKK